MSQTAASTSASARPSEVLERHLTPLLGEFTAKTAVRTAAMRALKKAPEEVGPAEALALLEGLRPMLNTFLGAERARGVLEQLKTSVGR